MSELVFGKIKGLPVNSNVVTVPAGHTLYAPGHVVQVQSVTKVDTFTTASTSFVDVTGMSLSITPKFATSKILVLVVASISQVTSSDGYVRLLRDSTALNSGTFGNALNGFAGATSSYPNGIYNQATNYLDSPATTAAVTYKVQAAVYSGGTFCLNRRGVDGAFGTSSSITLMEIAA